MNLDKKRLALVAKLEICAFRRDCTGCQAWREDRRECKVLSDARKQIEQDANEIKLLYAHIDNLQNELIALQKEQKGEDHESEKNTD